MRVLVVAATPPWPMTDGASLVLNHQLRHLAHQHEITVLAAGRRPTDEQPDLASVGLDPALPVRWFGLSGHRVRDYARRRVAGAVAGEPADVFAVELPELLAAFDRDAPRADVVHLHGWGTARLAARTATPTVHAAIDAWQRGHGEQRSLPTWRRAVEVGERRRIVAHERRHYPRCDAVVVVAPADAAVLRAAAPGSRIEVVPNGVDLGPDPAGPADEPVLGFHGVLSTVANEAAAVALVDDVAPLVRRTHPGARVLLVGKDPGPALLGRRSDVVEVTGEVADVRAELERVGVYVAAVERGSGIKNKVLEAMATGLPVVATPRAVDGIDCRGGLVVADDAPALATAATRLLDDRNERHHVGRLARACVEGATWEANAAALDALWHDVAPVASR